MQASLRLGARGPEALRLTLDGIDLVHRNGEEGLFALQGLEGVINWDAAENTRESHQVCRYLVKDFGTSQSPNKQVCRYLVKDFGTSQSPKSTRQRDSRYCP
ncbi:MAG: hypothetical protein AB2813_06565, partial [Candidatus Sedimenticola endophacoides]